MAIKCNVEFREEFCVGCGLCVSVCPRKILVISDNKMNNMGCHVAVVIDTTKCIGCGSCTMICPESVIKIIKK
ncbi:MAG: 4Fe-4S binding protein [Peptostreptococcaceae bacterium]|nr:4Fe-4S binding protein [Peptostreptococcaceae bacterium]